MTLFPKEVVRSLRHDWKADLSCEDEVRFFRIKELLFTGSSQWHEISIVDLESKGRSLFVNDSARVFHADEYIYHEALIHPVMQMSRQLGRNIRVLMVGDGDGGGIRELLRFSHVGHVVWIEIDAHFFRIPRYRCHHMVRAHIAKSPCAA